MRTPDKPGTFRIKRKIDGSWYLGGLTVGGRRIRMPDLSSEAEARSIAATLFPQAKNSPPIPVSVPRSIPMDDWEIPLAVDPGLAANMNETLGVTPPPPPIPDPPQQEAAPPVDEKKRAEDKERAKSLCEFFGVCWAAGDVWLAKKATIAIGKDPCNVSATQVNNLAKAAKVAFVDLLGDLEVGPWTMLMLLSIALPASMMIQSKARPKREDPSLPDAHLKSV